jgi:hypothetical protein
MKIIRTIVFFDTNHKAFATNQEDTIHNTVAKVRCKMSPQGKPTHIVSAYANKYNLPDDIYVGGLTAGQLTYIELALRQKKEISYPRLAIIEEDIKKPKPRRKATVKKEI